MCLLELNRRNKLTRRICVD